MVFGSGGRWIEGLASRALCPPVRGELNLRLCPMYATAPRAGKPKPRPRPRARRVESEVARDGAGVVVEVAPDGAGVVVAADAAHFVLVSKAPLVHETMFFDTTSTPLLTSNLCPSSSVHEEHAVVWQPTTLKTL